MGRRHTIEPQSIRRSARAALLACALIACGSPAAAFAAGGAPQGVTVDPSLLPAAPLEIAQQVGHVVWVQSLPDASGKPVDVVLDRAGGRTRLLPIRANLHDLDVGPLPGSHGVVAVYTRCAGGCDVWRYDFASRRERRVHGAATKGVSERLPSIYGDRIAFVRGRQILLLDGDRSRTLVRGVRPLDLELGPDHIAYSGEYDEGKGNGVIELWLYDIARRKERDVAYHVIGEGSSTGVGGLTSDASSLFWVEGRRSGCTPPTYRYRRLRYPRGGAGAIPEAKAPLGVQHAPVYVPETPESEGCAP